MKDRSSFAAGVCVAFLLSSTDAPASCGTQSVTITNLPTLGGSFVQADALNAAGDITGLSWTTGDLAAHAFLYHNGSIVDLGTLGGNSSEGLALNNLGQVVGLATTTNDFATHGFRYASSSIVDLGTLGDDSSVGLGINNAGVITGNSTIAGGDTRAFVYANGSMTNLGTLGGTLSFASAINQSGAIAGNSFTTDNNGLHAFRWQNGAMTDLGSLGGDYSFAFALNNSGSVVGESALPNGQIHGFYYTGGTMQDVGTLGGSFSTAHAVNNSGQVVGVSTTTGDVETHGFVFSNGAITDIGTLGGPGSEADAINNLGQVVGSSVNAAGNSRAILWQNGTLQDLNSLLNTNSGWELETALFINDAGRIVGRGVYNGFVRWFVLDLGFASANHAPVAVAGPDQTADCQTPVTLNGSQSSDVDGDPLSYQWTENNLVLGTNATITTTFDLGVHTITLTVTDPCGASSQTNVTVTIADTTPPVIAGSPREITASAGDNCQASVPEVLSGITASDNCTSAGQLVLAQDPVAGTLVGEGAHVIVVSVADASGNTTRTQVVFRVVDNIAPVITSSPASLSASAGDGCQARVPDVRSQIVVTDNCTPANLLKVRQSPTAGTLLGTGSYTIVVTVSDASGNSDSTNIPFTVADTTAPVIVSAPVSAVISNCAGVVPDVLSRVVATDNCTPSGQLVLAQDPPAGSQVRNQRSLTITVTDLAGNRTSKTIPLVFSDKAAPKIRAIVAFPVILWPPNHKLVPVEVFVVAKDDCDRDLESKIISITADEHVAPEEIQITGNLTAKLAAWRNPHGDGRTYTIKVRCTDSAGNSSTATTRVFVPGSSSNRY